MFCYFSDCDPGGYGVSCASQCGHCVGGNLTCDVVNGTCPGGCEDGFGNHRCDVGKFWYFKGYLWCGTWNLV